MSLTNFNINKVTLLLGPSLFIFFSATSFFPESPLASPMLGCMLWMAVWWIFESVPLGVTALLPVFIFPLTGILDTKATTIHYGNHIIFLFLGGFLVAYAMEKWNLHKRIALGIIKKTGTSESNIILGFMLSSYLLSMWISNTATTMMLIPPALATISQLKNKKGSNFNVLLLLSIAYSSSIGGVTTLVGTPPNLIFYNFYSNYMTEEVNITFFNWMQFALPLSICFFVIAFFYFKVQLKNETQSIDKKHIDDAYNQLGPIGYEEKVVAIVFVGLAISWMTRNQIDLGAFTIPGWGNLLPAKITDSSVAIFYAVVLFVIPSKNDSKEPILGINELRKIPLNILLLFGGGFALASGVMKSGLGNVIADQLTGLNDLPPVLLVACITTILLLLTEVSSNSAAIQLALPIVFALSQNLDFPSWMLMIPTTIACSFAFMLPVSTPPNAVIFESGQIKVKQMVRQGALLNLIGVIIILIATFTWGKYIF